MAYFGEIRCDHTGEVLESTDGKIKHPYITIRGSVAVQRYGEDGQRWLDFLTSGPSDRLVFKDPQAAADWFKLKMEARERGGVPVRRPRSFDRSSLPRPRRPSSAGPASTSPVWSQRISPKYAMAIFLVDSAE